MMDRYLNFSDLLGTAKMDLVQRAGGRAERSGTF
jgi:hypothetical protein